MELQNFSHLIIEWDMSPEDAVILYLEWGNNDWHNKYPPVRSKNDFSNYFVVDNWGERPLVRLVRRNSDGAEDLLTLELPDKLEQAFKEEFGDLNGVFMPPEYVKSWLKAQLEN